MNKLDDLWLILIKEPELGEMLFESQYPDLYEFIDSFEPVNNKIKLELTVANIDDIKTINNYFDSNLLILDLWFTYEELSIDFVVFCESIKLSKIEKITIDDRYYNLSYSQLEKLRNYVEIVYGDGRSILNCNSHEIENCYYWDKYVLKELTEESDYYDFNDLNTECCNISNRKHWTKQSKNTIKLYNRNT